MFTTTSIKARKARAPLGGVIKGMVSANAGARTAFIILMVLALGYWLWLGMAARSVTSDPSISILAAQAILEHGYPQLPSGFLYYRGALPHYLVAGSMGLFGTNDFAIMFPSLLMSAGSLLLVYLLAKALLGRPWLGVAAVIVLIALQNQTQYATNPRMYMTLQFFVTLAVYSAWRGFVEGNRTFQWVTALAVLGAIFSHAQGGALLVALPVAVLLVWWVREKSLPPVRRLLSLGCLLFLGGLAYYFTTVYNFPGGLPEIALRGGDTSSMSGLSLGIVRWAQQINWLEHTLPFGLLLAPLLAVFGFKLFLGRNLEVNQGALYLLIVLTVWALGVFGVIRVSGTRFWLAIIPIYALLLCASVAMAANWFKAQRGSGPFLRLNRRSAVLAGLIIWAVAITFGFSLRYGPTGYIQVVKQGYGVPCMGVTTRCPVGFKDQYSSLHPLVSEDDVIISSLPLVTNYYLGRLDGWLVQKRAGESNTAFEEPTDEYLGVQLIDTLDELHELKGSERRVWVIIPSKKNIYLNQQVYDQLDSTFHKHQETRYLTVYVNAAVE